MVSKNNVISTNSVCSCDSGDTINPQPNYFENKCPACGVEGRLVVETLDNSEIDHHSEKENIEDDGNTIINTPTQASKIVCKSCGAEYCGQDGYDLHDGLRGSLTTVNPNEISNEEVEEVSTTEENDTTYMSGWEGLCDLLKPLDGQAMMVQRGDYVVVKKIEMPQSARLWAYEGINVVDDSVSITDYTPEIYNTFIIKWGESFENELEFTFNKHKNLFGERKVVIEAKKVQVVGDGENSEDDKSSTSSDSSSKEGSENKSNGGIFDSLFGNVSSDVSNIDTSKIDTSGANGTGLDEGDVSGTSGSEAPKTEEVPITDREEAIQFGLTEVGKAKREDGHTIELKVIGNTNWQMGEWCHVKLPSFNEDSYMFISKCGSDSSPDSEFINSLTLVDYPPSLGKPDKKSQEENQEEETDSNSDTGSGTNDSNTDENTDTSNSGNDNNTNDNSTGNDGG